MNKPAQLAFSYSVLFILASSVACDTDKSETTEAEANDGDANVIDSATGDSAMVADGNAEEPSCGVVDFPCCQTEPRCEDHLHCATISGKAYCHTPCTPRYCQYDNAQGSCILIGANYVCVGTQGLLPNSCMAGETDCTTEYGVDTNTLCVSDGTSTYCVETCMVVTSGCSESTHTCVAFSEDEGVCVPRNRIY